jgi:peroxiredoxin Q/BCP
MTLTIGTGQKAPEFKLPDQHGNTVTLSANLGKWVILYFYPKDMTPGCTVEAMDFTASKEKFETAGATVLGVSPDSVERHQRFCQKKELFITLLSDTGKEVLESYGVWQKKKMAGREYMGVVRSTLIIDPGGVIRHVWEKVRVKKHVETVFDTLLAIQKRNKEA